MANNRDLPDYKLLFSIAYNFLGSVSEAEDIVQDVWLIWIEKGEQSIENPRSYLCKTLTNKCIDRLKELKKAREFYQGTWLPEPWVMDKDVSVGFEPLANSLMLLLEKLNPLERAVYLLREVFDFSYEDIGWILNKSEENCRQLLRRARQQVKGRKRYRASTEDIGKFMNLFAEAAEKGSFQPLIERLKEDAILYSDGGGKVPAALKPLPGASIIGKFLNGITQLAPSEMTFRFGLVNGNPGIAGFSEGKPVTVFSIEIDENRQISRIFITRNPDKMQKLWATNLI